MLPLPNRPQSQIRKGCPYCFIISQIHPHVTLPHGFGCSIPRTNSLTRALRPQLSYAYLISILTLFTGNAVSLAKSEKRPWCKLFRIFLNIVQPQLVLLEVTQAGLNLILSDQISVKYRMSKQVQRRSQFPWQIVLSILVLDQFSLDWQALRIFKPYFLKPSFRKSLLIVSYRKRSKVFRHGNCIETTGFA